MAQNIEIANAQYNDVPSIEVPKQGGGTASFVDTTDADATASDILAGKTAYVNGVKIVGTGSGGGGVYTETVLFSNSSGITSGSVALSSNLSDYNMIQFTLVRTGSSSPKEIVTNMATSGAVKNASRFCIHAFDNDYMDLIYASETSLTISGQRNIALTEVLGIKF